MSCIAFRAALLASVAFTTAAVADGDHAKRPNELFKPGVEHAVGEPSTVGERPPLIEGLGSYGMAITTSVPEAQAYFDQGLGHMWGFNHAEALRSFQAAQAIDPACAMCFWGAAYVLGPNLNQGMAESAVAPAWEAVGRAAELAQSPKERAMIEALQVRYSPDGGDREALNAAFASAMGAVAEEWPDDANVQTIYADALMNTQPWDYWEADKTTPKGNGQKILAALETALEVEPRHPAALHLFIHATEASSNPERAEAAADTLRGSAPAAGHLVHMPAHIYNRIGRFEDSIAVNKDAIAADEAFLARAGDAASPLYRFGYYPHNVHFLLVAAQMAGVEDTVIEASEKLAKITSDDVSAELGWVQAIRTAPFTAHAQFSDPETVLALDPPAGDFPYVKGFWHYARGVAHAALGDTDEATAEMEAIVALLDAPDMGKLEAQGLPARNVLEIAKHVVEARIAQAQGDFDEAAHHLEEAITLEDTVVYMEPPFWYYPVRQTLAAVLLQQGHADKAAEMFRVSLEQAPNNGWALWGLWQAEKSRGDKDAEEKANDAFNNAWLGETSLLTLQRL